VGEKLNDKELGFLRLILRSPDRGDGWRSVSSVVWPLVESFTQPDLIEIEPSAFLRAAQSSSTTSDITPFSEGTPQ